MKLSTRFSESAKEGSWAAVGPKSAASVRTVLGFMLDN